MNSNLDSEVEQLSADFKAFQQEMREMRRETDERLLVIQLETRDLISDMNNSMTDKITVSNDKFNTEMSSLSRDNTRFAQTIIIGAAVVSVISPVIKEIAPFVTELIKASISK
jgi:hypothetical protein